MREPLWRLPTNQRPPTTPPFSLCQLPTRCDSRSRGLRETNGRGPYGCTDSANISSRSQRHASDTDHRGFSAALPGRHGRDVSTHGLRSLGSPWGARRDRTTGEEKGPEWRWSECPRANTGVRGASADVRPRETRSTEPKSCLSNVSHWELPKCPRSARLDTHAAHRGDGLVVQRDPALGSCLAHCFRG